ncbi:MAG: zinc finger domain-containing protein, partial [Bacillota bacterium]
QMRGGGQPGVAVPVGELLRRHLDELPALFIVSGVELREDEPDPARYLGWAVGERGPAAGVGVGVLRAAGTRCERCWVYSGTVGADPEHPDLCERCADVLRRHS